jgi:NAD(P)-dependent dehydrogenase (short-subunit alcohol dehydrogenase family)
VDSQPGEAAQAAAAAAARPPRSRAGQVALLADPQVGYLTGPVLPVDGGWIAH